MGDYFNIETEDSETIIGTFDDMLIEWGKPCKLVYLTTETVCPNCIINPRTGESTNRYKPGGPVPFDPGQTCPVCDGKGKLAGTATNELITMIIDWQPKAWMNINGTNAGAKGDNLVRVPAGMVTSRGFTKDLIKVLRADNIYLDITNQYLTNEYKLYGQPYVLGAITNNRYFVAVWEKVA